MDILTQNHWESIYKNKSPQEVGWTQEVPQTSLEFIQSFNLSKEAKIIDVGGGDSKLVDYLLAEGYENLTVLDISAKALDKAKQRLGERAQRVTWIVTDITAFEPDTSYDVWHDRAAFHFLTSQNQINTYLNIARKAVNGYLVIGTFSNNGPEKCSGLDIKQYSEEALEEQLSNGFTKIHCRTEDHITPSNVAQNYLFCSFKRQSG